jgi:hypothetical protein
VTTAAPGVRNLAFLWVDRFVGIGHGVECLRLIDVVFGRPQNPVKAVNRFILRLRHTGTQK